MTINKFFASQRSYERLLLLFLLSLLLVAILTACASEEESSPGEEEITETVSLTYVEWDSEIATTYVASAILEDKMGYETELIDVTLTALYESVASGDQDGMLAAWLPKTQGERYEPYRDDVVDLGPNLAGTTSGLVVPDYVPLETIEELLEYQEEFENKIIGIEPDAGIMDRTAEAMEAYDLEGDYDLVTGSDQTMTTTLKNALEEERWIVVTGWNPHWKFSKWDLNYLQDPQNIYGEDEYIHTIVREGLEEDLPEVYQFLDNFKWEMEDIEKVMSLIQIEEMPPEEAAREWIENNKSLVESWLP